MFLLHRIILFSLASPSFGLRAGYTPGKMSLFKNLSMKNTTKPAAFNHDFSSLALGGTGSDFSLQKKIKEATEPLEQTIANLTKTNIQMNSKVSNLKDVIKELQKKKTSTNQGCSADIKQVKSLTSELGKAKRKVKSLKSELDKAEAKVNSLTLELSKAEGEVKSLTAELRKVDAEVKSLTAELGKMEKKLKTEQKEKLEVETKLDKVVQQLGAAKTSERSIKTEVKSLSTELSKAKAKLKTEQSEKLELKTRLDTVMKQLEAVSKSQKKEKKSQSKIAGKKVEQLSQKLSTAERKVETLQREKLELKTKLDKLTEQKTAVSKKTPMKHSGVTDCPRWFTNDKTAGICYGVVRSPMSFNSALSYCKRKFRARLAVLNTFQKFSAVRAAVKGRPAFWVGCHADLFGTMEWTDGTPVADTMWGPGEPNNDLEKCGELYRRMRFLMNDNRCEVNNYFVCEFIG